MAMTFLCVEASAYRVRYLATIDTTDPNPVVGFILNQPPTGVGLRKDTGGAFNNSPINQLVSQSNITTNALARRLLFGDDLILRPNLEVPRAHTRLLPGTVHDATLVQWSIDALAGQNVPDALSTNFACLKVTGPGIGQATCYIDVYYEHTFQR